MRLAERDSTYVEARTLILEFEKPLEDQQERKQGLWIDSQYFLWSLDSEKKTILSSNPVSPHQTTKEMCVQNPSPSWGTPDTRLLSDVKNPSVITKMQDSEGCLHSSPPSLPQGQGRRKSQGISTHPCRRSILRQHQRLR